MCVCVWVGGEEGGKGGLMPPPQGFVNEVIKGTCLLTCKNACKAYN